MKYCGTKFKGGPHEVRIRGDLNLGGDLNLRGDLKLKGGAGLIFSITSIRYNENSR